MAFLPPQEDRRQVHLPDALLSALLEAVAVGGVRRGAAGGGGPGQPVRRAPDLLARAAAAAGGGEALRGGDGANGQQGGQEGTGRLPHSRHRHGADQKGGEGIVMIV